MRFNIVHPVTLFALEHSYNPDAKLQMVGSKTVHNVSCLHPIRTCFFVTASTRLHAIDCYASHMQKEHTNYFPY